MKSLTFAFAGTLALGLALGGCQKSAPPSPSAQAPNAATTAPASGSDSTSGAGSSMQPPHAAGGTEKTVPAQGQVDAREPAQRRDFQKPSQ